MTERQRRKQSWFDDGMRAFERVTGQPAQGYLCPICVRCCTTLGDVTFEHAPPRSVGGREVALTCNECNSGAGHGIDAQLRKAQDVRDWSRGRHSKPLRGRFVVEGISLRADMDRTADKVTVVGIPELNDPANTAAQKAAFARIAASGEPYREPMRFTFAGYKERHARIALLRSAYVAVFARLGYRYVLRSTLDVVRQQILNPDKELIERFSLHVADPLERRLISWIERPKPLESVAVHIDDHLVFLPGMKADGRIYERLAARKVWPPRRDAFRRVGGVNLGWPTRPHHLFDGGKR
jgi:hypothetical protein